ncbi:unnamed protein product [Mytilus coruscus]|uniref:Reverse transcriptase RNase H-like domain-containing protein n=1 Tax=Mytilus coruscus TaxID=42192 RepID=A0A6J8BDT2_MYTCO|nr:unnamed protein product [Mytilus coruscus]
MQTLGMADVSCQIGPLNFIWSVYIAPIGDELLLGCDIIDEHDITINTKRGLEIKGQWINCDVTRRSDKIARVVLKEAVTIPANSEVILPGLSINSEILDSRYCSVEPVVEDERKIIVARSLVDPYKETIPVRIVNVGKYPIRIRKNYLLGDLHPVEQFEVFIDNNADVELYDSVLYKDFCIDMSQGDIIDNPVIPKNWKSPKVLSTKTDSFEIEAEIPKLLDFLSKLYQKICEKISDQEQKLKLAKVLLKNQGAVAKDKLDLGSCSLIKHKIDTAGAAPTRQPLRRTPKNFEGEKEAYLKDQLERGSLNLLHQHGEGQFILDTDASYIGIGSLLSQIQNGKEKVIAYGSKKLDKPQQRYSVTRRELLAVITFIHQFRHYLVGRKFLLRSDHASLRWLFNFKDLQGQLARWIETLSLYNFDIQHRPGVKHQNDSNWLSGSPTKELENFQREDSDLGPVHKWQDNNCKPNRDEIASYSPSTRKYWLNYDLLITKNYVLYQKRLQPTGESYQLLVLKVLKKEVMTSCHNTMY